MWSPISVEFAAVFIDGNATAFNLTQAEAQLVASLRVAPAATPDPVWTEDCLFLDVFVPKKVFDNRNNTGKKARVLLW